MQWHAARRAVLGFGKRDMGAFEIHAAPIEPKRLAGSRPCIE